jgi:hypothetical protein
MGFERKLASTCKLRTSQMTSVVRSIRTMNSPTQLTGAGLVLLCFTHTASAGIYRCEVEGQKAQYQSAPCTAGKSVVIKAPASPSPPPLTASHAEGAPPTPQDKLKAQQAQERSRQFPLENRLTVDLPKTRLSVALHVIADFVGYGLSMDPSITDVGDFYYKGQPAATVLADIASRFNLVINADAHTISVARR